jgi:hypothetical protein
VQKQVIVADPAETPVTIPEDEPIVAVPRLLLLHVLPEHASLSVEVEPAHALRVPEIAGGNGVTLTNVVL